MIFSDIKKEASFIVTKLEIVKNACIIANVMFLAICNVNIFAIHKNFISENCAKSKFVQDMTN